MDRGARLTGDGLSRESPECVASPARAEVTRHVGDLPQKDDGQPSGRGGSEPAAVFG